MTSSTYYFPASLQSVTITGGEILYGAFYNCSKLTSISLGNCVTSIGEYAFYNCSSLTNVTIPESVTSIGDYAFCNCRNLTGVTIPDRVTNIGDFAFESCSSLTSVTIGSGVMSIGNCAFYSGSSSLMSIEVSGNNSSFVSLDGVLLNQNQTRLIKCPGGMSGIYSIHYQGAERLIEDINGDGVVNAKDVTYLRRYLAGGYGVTLS